MEGIMISNVVFAMILLTLTALIRWIGTLVKKEWSPYKVFGVLDVLVGIAAAIVAIVEFVTPGGDLHGLFGMVVLLMFEPGVIIFLIADIFLYKKIGKKNE